MRRRSAAGDGLDPFHAIMGSGPDHLERCGPTPGASGWRITFKGHRERVRRKARTGPCNDCSVHLQRDYEPRLAPAGLPGSPEVPSARVMISTALVTDLPKEDDDEFRVVPDAHHWGLALGILIGTLV